MIDLNMFAYFSCNGFVGFPVLQDQTDPGQPFRILLLWLRQPWPLAK